MSLEPNPKQSPGSPHEPATPKAHFALSGNRLILGCAAAVLVLSTFAIGAGIGFGFGRLSASDEGSPPGGATASSSEQLPERDLRADLEEEFGTFWEAMDVLYENFYGALPDGDSATYDAIRGVVTNLDDPNTSFLSPDEADVFRTNITGSFEGIGARVDWNVEFDTVIVVEPFENQPAWNAGVRRNDLILAVNGESVVGTDLNSAVQKIRGPKGSKAVLTLLRPGENGSEPFEIEVERATIETPTVSTDRFAGETLGDGALAYIRLYTFNENSGALVKQAVEEAVADGAQGFILDLRGNSGGLLREAVKVSSLFLSDQVVLYERFRDGKEETYRTEEKGTCCCRRNPMRWRSNGWRPRIRTQSPRLNTARRLSCSFRPCWRRSAPTARSTSARACCTPGTTRPSSSRRSRRRSWSRTSRAVDSSTPRGRTSLPCRACSWNDTAGRFRASGTC